MTRYLVLQPAEAIEDYWTAAIEIFKLGQIFERDKSCVTERRFQSTNNVPKEKTVAFVCITSQDNPTC
jgi:hypothetical protein